MIRLLLFCTLSLGASTLHAQVSADTLARTPRVVSEDVLSEARADDDFVYEEAAKAPEGASLTERLMREIQRLFNRALDPKARPLHYALLIALLLWIVVKIARMEPRGAFRRAPAQVNVGGAMPDDIRARDYLHDARQARRDGDVRLALRFLFLHVLQRLAEAGQIAYRPEKTNRAYLREIGAGLRPHFAPFVRAFEEAWYGGTTPTDADFDALEADFQAFDQQLRAADAR